MSESPIFTLLRAAIGLSRREELAPASWSWSELYRTAAAQGVLAVVWDGVEHLIAEERIPLLQQPPRELRLQWALSIDNIVRRYERQKRLIAQLASFYHAYDIKMMVLKGYGMSLYYPVPSHRECGDIDMWQYGEQERADRLLREMKNVAISEDEHHHTTFTINGVHVENHYDFVNVHAHTSNKLIEKELKRLAHENGSVIDVDGSEVYLPSANFNALFLLRHAAAHFAAERINLRHLLDWALFLRHSHDSISWPWLNSFARTMNMHKFLSCINAICVEYFDVPSSVLQGLERDEKLERRVFNDIMDPEFAESMPAKGVARRLLFKLRRWWRNRWKHEIVYREGLIHTFVVQLYSHLLKPRSLR
jgi:hypothetical protein